MGQAVVEARKLAARMLTGPEKAIGSIKALLEAAEQNGMDAQLDLERNTMAQALAGEEADNGVSAFLNKERPKFRSTSVRCSAVSGCDCNFQNQT